MSEVDEVVWRLVNRSIKIFKKRFQPMVGFLGTQPLDKLTSLCTYKMTGFQFYDHVKGHAPCYIT